MHKVLQEYKVLQVIQGPPGKQGQAGTQGSPGIQGPQGKQGPAGNKVNFVYDNGLLSLKDGNKTTNLINLSKVKDGAIFLFEGHLALKVLKVKKVKKVKKVTEVRWV